jgi:penicillin-binding protein 1A
MERLRRLYARLSAQLPRRPWQLAVIGLFSAISAGVIAIAIVALALLPTLPPIHDLADTELKVPLRVYSGDGQLIAEFGEEKRIPIKIHQVPPQLIQAILAAEDHSFYRHHGVDVLGIVRAAWHNFRTKSAGQGASTITMQVARNYFLTSEKTYTRKLREMLLAFKIERELSKDEILELYINKIFLGHRAYGFAAAAQIYYGSALDKLSLPEIAMLAGLPKAPSRDNPLTNPASALERRDYVLRHMHGLGYIDAAALEQALKTPLTASRHALRYEVEAPYVAEAVRQYMMQTYDEKAYGGGFHVYTTIDSRHQRAANHALRRALLDYDRRHGYRGAAARVALNDTPDMGKLDDAMKDYRVVGELLPAIVTEVHERSAKAYTQDGVVVELDWDGLSWARRYIDENTVGAAPTKAADVVTRGDVVYLQALDTEGAPVTDGKWRLAQVPQVTGALVSLRPSDGAVLALTGGFDFYHSSFNRAMQAERQPGSSFKPFIYAAALEKGLTPATAMNDAPIAQYDATLEDIWRPENYSRKFHGPTRLRKALALSLNTVSIRLVRHLGAHYTADYVGRFGFDPATIPRNQSLALGTGSATPLQMASAFAIYANGGFRVRPYFIARVEDSRHEVIERADPLLACNECRPADHAAAGPERKLAPRVLSPQISFLMTHMMQDVIREGTGTAAKALGRRDLAGKTGTTDDYKDAWFSGYNRALVATAWVGFDQSTPLGRGEAGGRAALPMWIDYMRVALTDVPEQPLTPPDGIIKAYVDADSGAVVTASHPNAIEEYLMRGTETGEAAAIADGADTAGTTSSAAPPITPPEKIRDKLF